jgi:arsenate reductase (thioredoxin)
MKPKVLFLCTGNSARSQMAEAFMRKYAGDRFDVYSAGLEPHGINPLTIKAMQEAGFDMSGHYAKSVLGFLGKEHFGYLITVCSRAEKNCPIFPGVSVRLHWSFDDPAEATGSEEERLQVFRRVRDQIDQQMQAWLTEQGFWNPDSLSLGGDSAVQR